MSKPSLYHRQSVSIGTLVLASSPLLLQHPVFCSGCRVGMLERLKKQLQR